MRKPENIESQGVSYRVKMVLGMSSELIEANINTAIENGQGDGWTLHGIQFKEMSSNYGALLIFRKNPDERILTDMIRGLVAPKA